MKKLSSHLSVIKSPFINSVYTYYDRFGNDMPQVKDLPGTHWIYNLS